MGLLQRSLSLSNAKSLNFLDFTRKFNLKVCGIYKKEDNKYFISNSIGYDGISIISSVASADFWDGTVTEKNKLVKISERSKLFPFFQLFSFNLKDDISTLYYYSTEDSTLIICLSDDETIDEYIQRMSQNKEWGGNLEIQALSIFQRSLPETQAVAIENFVKEYNNNNSKKIEWGEEKTNNLIKELNEVINTDNCYLCVSRPRRFGKTMAENMLCAYYGRTADTSQIFSNMKIGQDEEAREKYLEHLN